MPAGDGSVVALDLFAAAAPAVVEVAVDAPGASRTYDYSVPDRLGPVLPGEAVLVEFGRQRQALGIVLGHGGSSLVQMIMRWPVETSPNLLE